MSTEATAIKRACDSAGGQAALARQLEVRPPTVSQWVKWPGPGGRRVPPARCPAIERLTGVRCEDLRPDIDWGVLRGTSTKRARHA